MDKSEKLIKYILWGSIALDITLCVCFVIGFSLGLGSVEIGFFMVGLVFRYGLTIAIISILLKFAVIALSFQRDTNIKRKSLFIVFFFGGSPHCVFGGNLTVEKSLKNGIISANI